MSNNKKSWFDELAENLRQSFFEARDDAFRCYKSVAAEVRFNDGSFIDIELHNNNDIDVFIYHADGSDRPCPNIVQHIEDNIPDWEELAEEYEDALIDW